MPSRFVGRRSAGPISPLGVFFVILASFAVPWPLLAERVAEEAAETDAAVAGDVDSEDAADTKTFLDELTVTATRSEKPVRDIPGQVDVIQAAEIERRGYTGVDDLVRYLPGVDVEGDPTRFGTSGFTIRGIGGNRVLTEIDGVPTSEQFDFGPFSVHRFALDVDTLESVEIVRSAGSALYGSDALGGVVALTTRGPRSYLAGSPSYLGLRGGFDGRSDEASLSGTAALGGDRWQGSILYTRRDGHELDNQGTVETLDSTRTAPNPIDRAQDDVVAQLSFTPSVYSSWRAMGEYFTTDAETEVLSSITEGSPFASAIRDAVGFDTQERFRLSLSHDLTRPAPLFDTATWRVFAQDTSTEQRTVETREPAEGLAIRDGVLTFDQETLGARGELRKLIGETTLLTYGAAYQRDTFDQLRDRSELVIASGEPVPSTLALPSKYFPRSDVEEIGVFAQAEVELFGGRLSLVPGVRFDRYDLDADQDDEIFLSGNPGTPPPVDLTEEAVSPKLGLVLSLSDEVSLFAQYARGFRAPPMSSVNNGFTNQAGGYRTLPNGDLEPETSDNLELGLRGSFGRGSFSIAAFDNRYEDFIELVTLGFDPVTFLIEFQPQNVEEVRIEGVELAGELRLERGFSARGAFTYTDGTDEIADQPLASISPAQLVLGLRYLAESGRWGGELVGTATDSKGEGDLPEDSTQFRVPSSEVLDLSFWLAVTSRLDLQVTAWNLTDETYWRWPYARGQTEGSAVLDRYTNPGRSFSAQLRYSF